MAILNRNSFKATLNSAASIPTVAYTVPATASYAVVSVYVLNTTAGIANVTVGISDNDTLDNSNLIQSDEVLTPSQGIERKQLILKPGERLIVDSNVSGVNVRVSGMEFLASNLIVNSIGVVLTTLGDGFNTLYTAPTSNISEIVDINLCNFSTASVTVNVAISPVATPSVAAGHYVQHGFTLPAKTISVLPCGIITAGERIIMETSADNAIAARVATVMVTA